MSVAATGVRVRRGLACAAPASCGIPRWDGRVADCGGFENRCALTGTGGSNPSPTAILRRSSRSLRSLARNCCVVHIALALLAPHPSEEALIPRLPHHRTNKRSPTPLRRLSAFACAYAGLLTVGLAQCELQVKPPRVAGANRHVLASTAWDPDGPGPATSRLVFGGYFSSIGTLATQSIAALNPTTWEWTAIGSGVVLTFNPAETLVTALAALPNGHLIVGGRFSLAGGVPAQYIARWNGSTWSALGSGLTYTSSPLSTDVRAIAALPNGDIVVGGLFTSAGGVAVNGIARWDGSAWHDMGGGVTFGANYNGEVHSLLVLPNGDLLVGGAFTFAGTVPVSGLARWNGTWSAMPAAGSRAMRLLQLGNGDVVAWWSNFATGTVQRWNGTAWSSLGAVTAGSGIEPFVNGLCVRANGDIVATGNFVAIGGVAASQKARWNGTAWSAMGSGMTPWMSNAPQGDTVVESPDGSLWLGGNFQTIGGATGPHLAAWNGSSWSIQDPIAANDVVSRIVADGEHGMLVGGKFTTVGGGAANRIAAWTGASWQTLGTGVSHTLGFVDAGVRAIVRAPDGSILAGGLFNLAGGVPVANVARWNGSAWSAMGDVGGTVNDLVSLANGELVAGGAFSGTVGTPLWNVARWTGSSWAPLGSNTTNPVLALLAMPDGSLIAAFDLFGPMRWNGSWWSTLGPVFPVGWRINDLALLPNGDVIAAGNFPAAGGVPALNVARWNGSVWSAMGAGIPWVVTQIAALQDGGIVAFSAYGNVHQWDGLTWVQKPSIAGALNGTVGAAASLQSGEIAVGGPFTIGAPRKLAILQSTCPAIAAVVPSACVRPGSPLSASTPVLPWLGGTMRTQAKTFASAGVAIFVTGLAPASLPLALVDPSAGPGCDLLVTPDFVDIILPTNGVASLPLAVPDVPILIGAAMRQQVVEVVLGPTSLLGVYASNALDLTIGSY